METAEQRAERIFKEDENNREVQENNREVEELTERRLKRIAVIAKYKVELDASIIPKQKGIKYRKFWYNYVTTIAERIFKSEEEEYNHIGKPSRLHWTDHTEHFKAYNKNDPMIAIMGEIMREFGCFEY